MPPQERETLIPYGRAKLAPGDPGEPAVRVRAGAMLRLSDGPYPFPEPPDLVRIVTTADRLALLNEHLQSLCSVWDRPAQAFLDAYFRWIDRTIAANAEALAAVSARTGGLFAPADWSFAAPRPLPQAHLCPDAGPPVRADFAFWLGDGLLAIELRGAGTRRQRQEELARLAAAGIAVLALDAVALQRDGAALLASVLPPPFQRFFAGLLLPASPFGPALDEIRAAD